MSKPATDKARQKRAVLNPHRAAFTLIEMLVSVALVLLIMSIFAQIYQIAGGALIRQKGMAENDQRSRLLTTLIKGDLAQRTFRDLKPYTPGQDTTAPGSQGIAGRDGYFSISENVVGDPTDDVLQLTINTTPLDPNDPEPPPLFGAATLLVDPADPVWTAPVTMAGDLDGDSDVDDDDYALYLLNNLVSPNDRRNQAEMDDGAVAVSGTTVTGALNSTGSARTAEVVFFLRNNNLIRRVLLIRDAYAGSGNVPPFTAATDYLPTTDPVDPTTDIAQRGSGEFWRDFDYSAYYEPLGAAGLLARFHDQNSLINDSTATGVATLQNLPVSLGVPFLRFGNSVNSGPGAEPREYIDMDASVDFIGRYTMRETSHSIFGYPGRIDALGDPFDRTDTLPAELTLTNGEVEEYADEPYRVSEDVLMTDVHEFDIKVWDEAITDGAFAPQFLDLGHGLGGDYGTADPLAGYGNRYDTWHPHAEMDDGILIDDDDPGVPPYRPVSNGDDGLPGDATIDDDLLNGIDDAGELGFLGTDDEIPLRAIQIRIRFLDRSSGRTRQLTIVQSLVD